MAHCCPGRAVQYITFVLVADGLLCCTGVIQNLTFCLPLERDDNEYRSNYSLVPFGPVAGDVCGRQGLGRSAWVFVGDEHEISVSMC